MKEVAATSSVHGVLLEISGVGILIVGPSGIGKSESALDLVTRGHRLIADDLIIVSRYGERVVGRGGDHAGAHMEIRGLGIINIRDLFGVASVLESKSIDLVVDLREWDTLKECDRLGLDEEHYDLLDVHLPYLRIPVSHGRNMAVILEVAARNYLLKAGGCFTSREFDRALSRRLADGSEEGKDREAAGE
jgi:HPr kinase/phosphorylase